MEGFTTTHFLSVSYVISRLKDLGIKTRKVSHMYKWRVRVFHFYQPGFCDAVYSR